MATTTAATEVEPDKPTVNGTSQSPATTTNDDPATATIEAPATTQSSPGRKSLSVDQDAQEMVISSLRTQIQDLFSQVNELNNKLVKSYDRVSDLEDDLHVASANLRTSSVRISQLEMERTQHLAALNTGLLVEKSHVTTELNRLMEKATEEAAQRGQAESARMAIEKDLDDLSASLFDQANTMVAEARYAQHLSEQKVIDAQRALKGAEEAVGIMQTQMQLMQSEKEEAERKTREMQAKMGKGKWLERIQTSMDLSKPLKLLSSHAPYQEYLMFVAHLRSLHHSSQAVPAMSTILPLPFLTRLTHEDSDPTIRLDLAPALNWLSRRSVLSAIHSGQLTIEPIPVSSLLFESTLYSSPVTVAGLNSSNDAVSCALCGTAITAVTEHLQHRSQRPPSLTGQLANYSWSGSFFKKSTPNRPASIRSVSSSHPPSPSHSSFPPGVTPSVSQNASQQVYIFRVAPQPTASTISSLPIPSSIAKSLSHTSNSSTSSAPYLTPTGGSPSQSVASSTPSNQPITIYPLCSNGWCLKRLRSTCTLWAFVRTGIVEKVWDEEMPNLPTSTGAASTPVATAPRGATPSPSEAKPPVPPRKRGLWGFASAIGERAASWSDSDKDKKKAVNGNTPSPVNGTSAASSPQAPPLPPRRESAAPAPTRRLPPPLPPRDAHHHVRSQSEIPTSTSTLSTSGSDAHLHASDSTSSVPPPLPKRNQHRRRPSAAVDGAGHEDEGAFSSNPSTPTKLLFDAAAPQSPLKSAKSQLPPVADEDTVAPITHGESNNQDTDKDKTNRFSIPRSIPLPESVPSSPMVASESTTSVPERTGSPAVTGVNGTAAPPPLPRRAAARRPVPGVPSRPTTPQTTPPPPPTDQVEPANGDAKESSSTETNEAPAAPVAASAAEEEKPTESDKVDGKPAETLPGTPKADELVDRSAQSSPDVFVDAVSPSAAASNADPLSATASSLVDAKDVDKEKAKAGASEDRSVEKKVQDVTVVAPPAANSALAHSEHDDDQIASSPIDMEPPQPKVEDPNDKEVYIGDATWEERTWKELARLREEMFWARLGGSRQ